MIPLEVVQGRMASQDGQNGALQFDSQLVAVLVSHVWTGESEGQVVRDMQHTMSGRKAHRAGS